jgi:hypothetical protein
MLEMGTKLPFSLHSQPWAALNAAPREAESVREGTKIDIQRLLHQAQAQNHKGTLALGKKKKKSHLKILGLNNFLHDPVNLTWAQHELSGLSWRVYNPFN